MNTLANSPLNRLLSQNPVSDNYAETSRYSGLPTHTCIDCHGRMIRYTGRRFIKAPEDDVYEIHKVEQGDRPDTLAYRYLGNSEGYWELCDLNGVSKPWQLTADLDSPVKIGAVSGQFAMAPTLKI